jgi:hypothetical protein
LPAEFLEIFEYLLGLKWAEEPDYAMIKARLEHVVNEAGTEDGSQGDSSPVTSSDSGQQDGGSGGNTGNPFNGSGSVAAPIDDYAAGLASYDPSKVGLPDS